MEPSTVASPPVVGLSLEGPRPQRRLTVGFRIILAIPHLLWLLLLTVVATLVAIVAWVGALVLGRMPDGLGEFLGRIVQYGTRVNAYLYLLTDRYPPFSLTANDYPVEVLLPPRGRLNRGAVLVRLLLVLPALIVLSLTSSGLQLGLIVVWLIVVISSRMPNAAFEVVASYLRYTVRAYAFLLMLTSEYPRGLFGDRPASAPAAAAAVAPGPAMEPPSPPVSTLPPPVSSLPPPPSAAPRITRIVLSKAGRRLMVLFIVLGILVTAGQIAVAVATSGQSDRARREVDREYAEVVASSNEYGLAVQGCGGVTGDPACLQRANQELGDALRELRFDLLDVEFPAYAIDAAEDLLVAVAELGSVVDQMAVTSEPTAYQALFVQFQDAANRMDEAYFDLRELLLLGF